MTVVSTNEIGDSPPSAKLSAYAENYANPPGPPVIRNE